MFFLGRKSLLKIRCDLNLSRVSQVNAKPSRPKIRWLQEMHAAVANRAADLSDFTLQSFPDSICDIWEIEQLNLSSNLLTRISAGIRALTALTELNLANNAITVPTCARPNAPFCTSQSSRVTLVFRLHSDRFFLQRSGLIQMLVSAKHSRSLFCVITACVVFPLNAGVYQISPSYIWKSRQRHQA
jgi:hypothetical protein